MQRVYNYYTQAISQASYPDFKLRYCRTDITVQFLPMPNFGYTRKCGKHLASNRSGCPKHDIRHLCSKLIIVGRHDVIEIKTFLRYVKFILLNLILIK